MGPLSDSPEQAAQFVWWMSLALGLVVSLVVALLLWLIHQGASTINERVARIWEVGQRVANNTVHIPALYKTHAVAGEILASALRINAGAAAIKDHASGCPGCPQCMLKHRESRP
jgi:membrane protein YdbS with pleckstrin-like domain